MRTLGRFVALLLLVGFVGAYFWPIALTIAAATIAFHLVLRRLTRDENDTENGDRSDNRYSSGRDRLRARSTLIRLGTPG